MWVTQKFWWSASGETLLCPFMYILKSIQCFFYLVLQKCTITALATRGSTPTYAHDYRGHWRLRITITYLSFLKVGMTIESLLLTLIIILSIYCINNVKDDDPPFGINVLSTQSKLSTSKCICSH
jgi:hypothetical protein